MNIDMIEVIENNNKFIIVPNKEIVLIDNKCYPIKNEKIKEFIRIIRNWNHEYIDNRYYDGNYFEVNVYYDGKVDRMRGFRGMPNNYQEFVDFVRSIYDAR